MLQNARFTAFTVSELLTKNQHGGGGGGGGGGWGKNYSPTQIRVKKTTLKRFYSDSSLSVKLITLETFPCQ